jgi:uncharacterized membrane protein
MSSTEAEAAVSRRNADAVMLLESVDSLVRTSWRAVIILFDLSAANISTMLLICFRRTPSCSLAEALTKRLCRKNYLLMYPILIFRWIKKLSILVDLVIQA